MATAIELIGADGLGPAKADAAARVLAYAKRRTAAGATIHRDDAATECDISYGTVTRVLKRLENDGSVIRLAGRDGWIAAEELIPTLRHTGVTLADLLDLARKNTSECTVAKRGRQALHVSRDLVSLTPGQLADVERLVALIARNHPRANGDPAAITDGAFTWDNRANQGRGGWALVERVRSWAEEEHRAKHESRQSRTPQERRVAWHPDLASDTVRDYQGAANNLLHLAATHGWISRSPLSGGLGGTLYAPCWVPIIDRWFRWLKRRGGATNPRRTFIGCRTLALYATRIGGRNMRTTDWLAVRYALERDAASNALSRTNFEAARYVWRHAVSSLGGLALKAYEWRLKNDDPVSLVSMRAIDDAAVVETTLADRDFSSWVLPDGRAAAGLVEGRYGLRRWAAWSTLDDMLLRRQAEPLPSREWVFPSSIVERRKDKRPEQVTQSTLQTRLRLFAFLAGYAAREHGVDWTSADGLLRLADPELIDAFITWTLERPADPRGDRRTQLFQIVRTMAWLVNGFLAGQAKLAGDEPLHERLREWYHRLEKIAQEDSRPRRKRLDEVIARVLATANGWKGYDGEDGLKKIGRLTGLLERDLLDLAGGRTIAQQLEDLGRSAWCPSRQWATTLRMIVVLLVVQRIPLRGRTVANLKMEHWVASPVGAEQQERAHEGDLHPWEGAISLEIPGPAMKGKRPFSPPLILAENVLTSDHPGSSAHEAALRRDLLQLWFCRGGGRDICRTRTDPVSGQQVLLDVPWVFPDAIGEAGDTAVLPRNRNAGARVERRGRKSRNASKPGLWTRSRLSAAFGRAARRHARALAINLGALRRVHGALGFHVVRRLFGSYWAPKNLLVTSRLMDHKSIALTANVYCAQDVRTMSLDVAAAP